MNCNNLGFWPEQINFEILCSIISIVLGILSIVISIVLYKISSDTSKRVAENAAKFAIEYHSNNAKQTNNELILSKKQIKRIKKKINTLFKKGKKNSKNSPWVTAIMIPTALKKELNESETVSLMNMWMQQGYMHWDIPLEITTKVFFDDKENIIESINSRKS